MKGGSAGAALFFANAGHALTHMLMLLYPTVVLTLQGSFDLTYGELMWLSLPGTVLYGLAALPAGWLGDRWSAEHMMVLFFVGSGVAAIVTSLADTPLGITIGLALVGFFGSIYHPVGTAWLVRNSVNRGRTLGWNGIFGSIGIGLAPVAAGALSELWSWRAAFLVPGLVCLALGLGLALFVRNGTIVAGKIDRRVAAEPARGDVWRAFFVLSVTMLAAGLVFQAISVVLPKLFEERLADMTHGTVLGTGGFVSLVFLVSGGVPLLGGWLADRYSMKLVYLVSWALQAPLLAAAATLYELPLFASSMLVFCLMNVATPTENALLAYYTPGKWRATAYGAKFVLSLGVAALGVPLVAFVYDTTGDFVWLFAVLAGLAALIVAAGLFLPQDRPSRAAIPVPAE